MPDRPFIPAPNTASIEMIYQEASEISENIIHVDKGSPYSLSDLQGLRNTIDTFDTNDLRAIRVNGCNLARIRTKALDSLGSAFEDYALPVPRAGTAGTNAIPLNVCFCIKFATGLTGRSFRGRLYIGHFSSTNLQDMGHVSAAAAASFATHYTSLKTALSNAGHRLVIVSYRFDKAWRTTAVNTAVATVTFTDTNLDSQRRRLPGRGHGV